MVAIGRRIATWVLLSNYLFAVTAASLFHNHRPDACGHDGDRGRMIATADGGGGLLVGERENHVASSPEHGCAVCQFLSQKVAPTRPVEALHVEAMPQFTTEAPPVVVARSSLRLQRTRAPPLGA
ncbi:MAG: hypothetical protein NTY19_26845 [Planctomycetota bacterium]|nr:hypothetical protein [Planctomycetota bacterium]